MIELFFSPTPNGRKISIMLEEIEFDYKITKIDLSKGDQFKSEFRKMSPLSKMPAIIDHKNKVHLFQSGAILIYLAELSNKFYDVKNKNLINQWLMTQMGDVGPMLGQHHHYHHFNPGKNKLAEERYFNIATRLYKDLDEHLKSSKFLAGENYSIADIACFAWMRGWKGQEVPIEDFPNVKRWMAEIESRPAVKLGLDTLKDKRRTGPPKGKEWEIMFGKEQFKRR